MTKNCICNYNYTVTPFLKWAGGKRWLINSHPELFKFKYNRYIEPFLGGGSVFFHLSPDISILSDKNTNLIETYSEVKSNATNVYKLLEHHQVNHSKDYYYTIRSTEFTSAYERAAQFIYLNRTCWNGLYRVNVKNKFNVPIGTKSKVVIESAEEWGRIASILNNATILSSDFEAIIDKSQKGDFVFVDPPYTVMHDNNGFIKYNDKLFSWDDQVRLRDTVARAKKRGSRIIITNADHYSIKNLYSDFKQIEIQRSSVLAGSKDYRRKVNELIIIS